jgi:hypothetical protein
VLVVGRERLQVGLVALEAEHVPAAELGHERGVLARAEDGVAGHDPELTSQRIDDAGQQLAERRRLALLGTDEALPDAGGSPG